MSILLFPCDSESGKSKITGIECTESCDERNPADLASSGESSAAAPSEDNAGGYQRVVLTLVISLLLLATAGAVGYYHYYYAGGGTVGTGTGAQAAREDADGASDEEAVSPADADYVGHRALGGDRDSQASKISSPTPQPSGTGESSDGG